MHIAFEDDRAMAVLVTEPMNPGQFFLVPKAHVTTLDEMGEKNTAHPFEITRRLVQAIRKAGIRCEGTLRFICRSSRPRFCRIWWCSYFRVSRVIRCGRKRGYRGTDHRGILKPGGCFGGRSWRRGGLMAPGL